jgi:hypothetical protein
MSAILHAAGLDAELCPHPEARQRAAVAIRGSRRSMVLCIECKQTQERLIRDWFAYNVRPSTVIRTMRRLDYDQVDALQFLFQLVRDRALLRVGLLRRVDVEV